MTIKDKIHTIRIPEGLRVRIHRILFQLVFIGLMFYFFGLQAFVLLLLIFACELPSWGWLDKMNPWCTQYKKQIEEEDVKEQIRDLVGHVFPGARVQEIEDEDDIAVFDCPHSGRPYDDKDYYNQKCSICNHDAKSNRHGD